MVIRRMIIRNIVIKHKALSLVVIAAVVVPIITSSIVHSRKGEQTINDLPRDMIEHQQAHKDELMQQRMNKNIDQRKE